MSATITYGGYTFPNSWLTITEREMKTQVGRRLGKQVVWDIGGTFNDRSSSLASQISAFEAATASNGSDLVLASSDGGHSLSNGDTINGIRVVRRHYPKGNPNVWGAGLEFAGKRSYQATFAAETFDPEGEILVWKESVRLVSNGQRDFEIVESSVGYTEEQETCLFTKSVVLHSGMAIGATAWPAVAPPIWPQFLKPRPILVEYAEPQKFGINRNTMFPTRWAYRYEAPSGQIDSTFPPLAFS